MRDDSEAVSVETLADASGRLQRATWAALRLVSSDALTAGVGATLPRIADYRERLGVGSGTVQQALRLLQETGSLRTVARGHLGRRIEELQVGRIWDLAGLPPVRVLLPPRGPREVRAMTRYVADHLSALGVPHAVGFSRGADRRLEAVRRGEADLAMVSSGVGGGGASLGPGVRVAAVHDEGTFYAEGQVVVLRRANSVPRAGVRVAIDPSSRDQRRITEAEFPRGSGVAYVPVDFPRVPVAILEGVVDTGVWHRMQTLIPPELAGLSEAPLSSPAARAIVRESSSAVLVVATARTELEAVLRDLRPAGLRRAVTAELAPPVGGDEVELDWTV
ncbi:helix-turn-helix protein [Microbacterium sp. SLBN-154]|uniref:YhfZ family protein n=1 Tax=Microbacterium sp. SLBN-154 TaxID=2768458 RepID=UPI001152C539|nr:YhfZ family protein [Microbacterium sp. SLBN-154]TQK17654.1 helix-turn-helix protein [Microbacterium sp. SLBN-154]